MYCRLAAGVRLREWLVARYRCLESGAGYRVPTAVGVPVTSLGHHTLHTQYVIILVFIIIQSNFGLTFIK